MKSISQILQEEEELEFDSSYSYLSEEEEAVLNAGYGFNESFEMLAETVELLQEKSIVKMDNKSMRKRLLSQAALICAKEAGDVLYEQYNKYTKLRREARAKIQRKYSSKAKAKVKEFIRVQKEN